LTSFRTEIRDERKTFVFDHAVDEEMWQMTGIEAKVASASVL
jgi:hypothetical protein